MLVCSDEKSDSLQRIGSLDSFFRKESIQKIRSLYIDSLLIEINVYSVEYDCIITMQ